MQRVLILGKMREISDGNANQAVDDTNLNQPSTFKLVALVHFY